MFGLYTDRGKYMPEDVSQDDIDKLLEEALGGPTSSADTDENTNDKASSSQDGIDALLSDAMGGDTDSVDVPPEATVDNSGGTQSQDDIDALLAGANNAPTAESDKDSGGAQSQDDTDALLSGALGEPENDSPVEASEEKESEDSGGAQSQDDIDALLSGVVTKEDEKEENIEESLSNASSAETLIADESLSKQLVDNELSSEVEVPAAEESKTDSEDDLLDGLLSDKEDSGLDKTTNLVIPDVLDNAIMDDGSTQKLEETATGSSVEKSMAEAFDEVSPALASALNEHSSDGHIAEDVMGLSTPHTGTSIGESQNKYKIDVSSISESFSLLQSGSEIEGITGEIASLLGQLSERARRSQSAFESSNQEIGDLRSRLRAAEKRVSLLNSEKISMQEELTVLKSRIASTEEEHIFYVEKSQSDISSLQIKVRERDNRLRQLETEIESTTHELKNNHNLVANADVESRRSIFELERTKTELDAERQERARLQRMLDMREQEIQAIQSRSAGEASSLFMDELHRLIRRLESELNVRTGAAREALQAIEGNPSDPAAVDIARKNLLIASGIDEDSDTLEELNRLERQTGGVMKNAGTFKAGNFSVSLDEFSTDLNNLEMEEACIKAGRILSEKSATPVAVMDRIYKTDSLRTEKAGNHLVALIMLFQSIDKAQKKFDSVRGRENSDTEKTYVMIFDMLHYLVRIKAINKSTPEAWSFFLEIRGKYSFITSDTQWSVYRDKQLKG